MSSVLPEPRPLPPRKTRRPLEKTIEGPACKHARTIGYRTIKISGAKDWPDRLMITPSGFMFFVEFKRPKEKPRPSQAILHDALRRKGATVYVCDDETAAIQLINAHAATPPVDPRVWLPIIVDLVASLLTLFRVR